MPPVWHAIIHSHAISRFSSSSSSSSSVNPLSPYRNKPRRCFFHHTSPESTEVCTDIERSFYYSRRCLRWIVGLHASSLRTTPFVCTCLTTRTRTAYVVYVLAYGGVAVCACACVECACCGGRPWPRSFPGPVPCACSRVIITRGFIKGAWYILSRDTCRDLRKMTFTPGGFI